MSTIEDKILDGPSIHYCDADNDDIRIDDESNENHRNSCTDSVRNDATSLFKRPDEETERLNPFNQIKWQGGSTNTGPKGVIEDFKKRSLSKDQNQDENNIDELESEFRELLNDDSILKEFISKRISSAINYGVPSFGLVYRLQTGTQLLDAIDKENPNVIVLVHLYTKYSKSCAILNRCLDELANDLKHIKFVTLDASVTNLSGNFKENGVPALLGYKRGDLVKSLVQLDELLDKDFDATQVKELLIDNGLIG